MTLLELTNLIKDSARKQDSVHTIVDNDIYRLNELADVRYGAFAYTQNIHTSSIDRDYIAYDLTLFYVDLVREDLSNQIEVQSTAIEVLESILQDLYATGVVIDGDYSFQPFYERFTDFCTGCFVQVKLLIKKSLDC